MKNSTKQSRRTAFTLVEMMVVMAIIAALAAVVTPAIFKYMKDAKRQAAVMQIKNFDSAVKGYYMDLSCTPKRLEDLVQDTGDKKWNGPYLEGTSTVPPDPWGEPYHYDTPGSHNKKGVDIYSYGADKAPGGEGENADIDNWGGERK